MGASVSKNTSDIVLKTVNTVSNEIVQKDITENNQSIAIIVKDTKKDVIIDGVKTKQTATVSVKSLLSALSDSTNQNKINEQVESICKSLISGLNLAQISTSISTLSNVIDNCIKIINTGSFECSHKNLETFLISIDNTQGSVVIRNLDIEQVSNSITNCIMSSSNNSKLVNETDSKIKQITSAESQGLDIKWIAIAAALGVGGLGMTGVIGFSKLFGPILILGGGALAYYGYTNNQDKEINSLAFIKNKLDISKYDLSVIKVVELKKSYNARDHGEADVYETFGGNVTLYKKNLQDNNTTTNDYTNIKSDITTNDIIFEKNDDSIGVSISGSSKYTKKLFDVPIKADEIEFLQPGQIVFKPKYIYIDTSNFEVSHRIKILYTKDEENPQLFPLDVYYVEPTIITTNEKKSNIEIIKTPMVFVGLTMAILGSFVMFSMSKDK
ncbi:Lipid membrane protein [Dasineura jujubifolia toursvirus 2a]|nr:Lipid membrane protein [Dasineura jujubifolia toursvirus 2a]